MAYQTYRVRAGDTLTRIARDFRTTVDRLATLNGLRDRNRILAGQRLRVDDIRHPRPPRSPLGSLSRKYEVGSRGPGTVSSGRGDRGGISYGTYQLAGNLGRPEEFLAAEGQAWAPRFAQVAVGSGAYGHAWRQCAMDDPVRFEAAQHRFIERTHFAPQCALIERKGGLDVITRSRTVQDVVWSTAVHHGAASHAVLAALGSLAIGPAHPGFDRALIDAIYAERGRRLADGRLAHFRSNSRAVQESVARRFASERADALAMLVAEQAAG